MNRTRYLERLARATLGSEKIAIIIDTIEELMSAIEGIQAALTQLVADTTTALADIKMQIAALQAQVDDPAAVQAIVDSIDTLDAQVKAADPGTPAV